MTNAIVSGRAAALRLACGVFALLLACGSGFPAGAAVVSECTESALRTAVAGGGYVAFACDGTITLSTPLSVDASLVLDGTGHHVTLSGGRVSRVLAVQNGATLTLSHLTIANGFSQDGAGGGGVYNAGTLNVRACSFQGNSVTASNAAGISPIGLPATGGAIYNASTGVLSVEGTTFSNNSATGGAGVNGSNGAIMGFGGGIDGGPGTSGGDASGGAIYNVGTARIVNATFALNWILGGAGGNAGWPGYTVIKTTRGPEVLYGAPGLPGQGGTATAAAVYAANGNCAMTNCTLALNVATSGVGGSLATFPLTPGPGGAAAGCVSGASLVNCLLAGNTAGDSFADGGHNVASATADGVVVPVADNGGPTLTMALPPGSPAIDAADNLAAPPTDQRGIPRSYGAASDAGAFESQGSIWLQASLGATGAVELRVNGSAAQIFRLLASTNLTDWTPLQTNQLGLDQCLTFQEPGGTRRGFYRAEMLLGEEVYHVETLAAPIAGGSVFGGGGFLGGYQATVLATPNPGYVFLDWTEHGAAVNASTNYSFTVAGNRTLIADFAALCTINVAPFPAGGGSATGGGLFVAGSTVTVEATPNSGFVFLGWNLNGALVTNAASYTFTATGNATVTAEFAALCVVTVLASPALEDGSVTGGGSFPPGSRVTVTATPSAGFGFVNWTEDVSVVSGSSNYTFSVSSDRTLAANFAPLFTVATSVAPAQGGFATGGGVFLVGTSVTVVAVTNSGYAFVYWAEEGTPLSASASYTFTVTTNRALTAEFVPLYSVTALASPGAGGTASGGTFAGGSVATVAAVPAGGYAFVNWTEIGLPVSASPRYIFPVAGNRTLTANFAPARTVGLVAAPPQGGSVRGGGVFPTGAALTVTATPTPGYTFTNWTENGLWVSASPSYTFTPASNRLLTANFLPLYPGRVVSECTEAALRSAMAGGGSVSFGCDGTIVLTNAIVVTNHTVLDGTGHQVAIAGSGSLGGSDGSQGFHVHSNVTFTLIALTLTNCTGPINLPGAVPGGAILNDGGNLFLSSVSFLAGGAMAGGAIYNTNGGTVSASDCIFARNLAEGGPDNFSSNPSQATPYNRGGAICSESGVVYLRRCTFLDNTAMGPFPFNGIWMWAPHAAQGGAIYNGGHMTVEACTFAGNSASGTTVYASAGGGAALGGALWNGGTLAVSDSAFLTNTVAGGFGGGGAGGQSGQPGEAGGDGGAGLGGAIYNAGTASLGNSTFCGNSGSGGQGGRGGLGGLIDPWTHAASGPTGGTGFSVGAICDDSAGLSLTNCTLAWNSASTGVGGLRGGTALVNTLFAMNSGNDIPAGADAGHNLSSDDSCRFTNLTSFNHTDPLLAPPADNGGPTPTLALLPGSPAIDAGDTLSAPPTDQRGFLRPYAAAADIGAFEAMPLYYIFVSASPAEAGSVSGGGRFGSGATVMLLAVSTPPGFASWTENGTLVSTNPAYAFIANSDRTLTANFVPFRRVTLLAVSAADGAVSGAGEFRSGAEVTVRAASNPGSQFVAWTENGQVVSTSPSYRFTLEADRTLQACFAPYPFLPARGTYAALFSAVTNNPAPQSCGLLSFAIGARGAYSGSLQLAGRKYPLSGRFDAGGEDTVVLARPGSASLSVRFQLDLLSAGARVTGTVSNSSWTAAFTADRGTFDARTNPAPQRGSYTLVFRGAEGSATQPTGDGYGTLTVSASGLVSLHGTLAEGTRITPGATLSGGGGWPLYASLQGGQGVVCGWLSFTNATALTGAVVWVRQASSSGPYRSGFSLHGPVTGARYVVPDRGTNVLALPPATTLRLSFQGGGLAQSLTNLVTLSANDHVSLLSGPRLSLTFTPASGAFHGYVVVPRTTYALPFGGVVIQDRNAGFGFFLGPDGSGIVNLGR